MYARIIMKWPITLRKLTHPNSNDVLFICMLYRKYQEILFKFKQKNNLRCYQHPLKVSKPRTLSGLSSLAHHLKLFSLKYSTFQKLLRFGKNILLVFYIFFFIVKRTRGVASNICWSSWSVQCYITCYITFQDIFEILTGFHHKEGKIVLWTAQFKDICMFTKMFFFYRYTEEGAGGY